MSETLFTEATPTTPEAIALIGEYDPTVDYRSKLVGEGQKYADDNMLAFSRLVADQHIDKLHKENAGIRQDLKTRMTVAEAVAQARSQSPTNESRQPAPSERDLSQDGKPALTAEEVETRIDQALNQYASQRTRAENLKEAQDGLRKTFGEKYVTKLDEAATNLGVDRQFMDTLAGTNPKAFLKMVGATETVASPRNDGAPRPSVNTDAITQFGPKEKKFKDYEKLRKDNPSFYWTPKVQNEMTAELSKQGDTFYN